MKTRLIPAAIALVAALGVALPGNADAHRARVASVSRTLPAPHPWEPVGVVPPVTAAA